MKYDNSIVIEWGPLVRRAVGAKDILLNSDEAIEESMKVNGISLMKSEQGKHGMVYKEIGYVRAF